MTNSEPIKLGFIGLGFVCQQCHLPTFSVNPNFKINAISDPFDDLREEIGDRFGVKNQYISHYEMLKKADIDAVVITLPRRLTYSVVRDCLNHDKWVFTEKPLCLDLNHAEEILDLAIRKRKGVYVGYMKSSDKGTELYKKQFNTRSLNSIKTIRAFCHSGYSYASPFGDIKGKKISKVKNNLEEFPSWLSQELRLSYEQYLNTFSHISHSIEFITEGELSFINYVGNKNGEGFLNAKISGIEAPVIIQTSRGEQNEWIEGIEIVWKDFISIINYPAAFLRNVPATITNLGGDGQSSIEKIRPQWSWSFLNQTYDFHRMIKSKKYDIRNLISSVNQVRLVDDLYKSLTK